MREGARGRRPQEELILKEDRKERVGSGVSRRFTAGWWQNGTILVGLVLMAFHCPL